MLRPAFTICCFIYHGEEGVPTETDLRLGNITKEGLKQQNQGGLCYQKVKQDLALFYMWKTPSWCKREELRGAFDSITHSPDHLCSRTGYSLRHKGFRTGESGQEELVWLSIWKEGRKLARRPRNTMDHFVTIRGQPQIYRTPQIRTNSTVAVSTMAHEEQ